MSFPPPMYATQDLPSSPYEDTELPLYAIFQGEYYSPPSAGVLVRMTLEHQAALESILESAKNYDYAFTLRVEEVFGTPERFVGLVCRLIDGIRMTTEVQDLPPIQDVREAMLCEEDYCDHAPGSCAIGDIVIDALGGDVFGMNVPRQ